MKDDENATRLCFTSNKLLLRQITVNKMSIFLDSLYNYYTCVIYLYRQGITLSGLRLALHPVISFIHPYLQLLHTCDLPVSSGDYVIGFKTGSTSSYQFHSHIFIQKVDDCKLLLNDI